MTERELRLWLRIADELRSLQKEIKTANENAKTYNNSKYSQPIQPLPVKVVHAPNLDPARREYYESENRERKSWWKKAKPWVEAVGVVVALALAGFTYETLREVQEQTTISEQQTRPWLKISDVNLIQRSDTDDSVLYFMTIAPGSKRSIPAVNLGTEIVVNNIGHSMANDVVIEPRIIFHKFGEQTDIIPGELTKLCDSSQRESAIMFPSPSVFTWSAVFPNDSPVKARIVIAGLYEESYINHIPNRVGNYLNADLAVCVSYQRPRPYQTRAVYHIMGPKDRFIPIGRDMSSKEVRLLRDEHYEFAR